MALDLDERLPCGRPVDALLGQVAERTPSRDQAHQDRCPHCRATLAHLEALWGPVHVLAAEQVRAPAGLLQAVMAQIRELGRSGWSAVLAGDGDGRTRVAARVVGAVARLAAESVPAVTVALGGGRSPVSPGGPADPRTADGATSVGVAGDRVVVDLEIAVEHGVDMLAVAQRVRDRVARHIAAQTGLTTTEVNVVVVDVRAAGR